MPHTVQGFLITDYADKQSIATKIAHSESVRKYRPIEHVIRIACESDEHPVAFVRDCIIIHKLGVVRGSYYWASVYRTNERHLLPYQDIDIIVQVMSLSRDIVLQYLSGRLLVLNTKTFGTSEHFLEDRDDSLVVEHGVFVDNGQLRTFDPVCSSKIRELGIKVKSPSHLAVSSTDSESGGSWYYDVASSTVKENKWNFPAVFAGCNSYVASTDGGVVWKIKSRTIGIHTLQLDGSFSEEAVVHRQWDYVALVGTQNNNVVVVTRDDTKATSSVLIMNRLGEVLKTYPLDSINAPKFVKPYGLITFVKNGVSLNTLIC